MIAAVAAAASVAVWHAPMASGRTVSTSIHYSVPKDADPIAAITTFAPAGYRIDLSRPPGTRIGSVVASVFSRTNNLTLPLSGSVVTDAPAKYVERSKVCAQTPNSAAVWILNLTLAGQTLSIPTYVNPTSPDEQALGAYKVSICLPSWDVPESQGGAPQGAQILDATFTVNGVVTTPPGTGLHRWDTLYTPYLRGTGTANVAGTFEARAFVPLPVAVSIEAKGARAGGKVTERGVPVAGAAVAVFAGKKKLGRTKTNAAGAWWHALPKKTASVRATGSVGQRDYTATGCQSPTILLAPAGCVSATLSPWSATSTWVKIRH